MIIIYDPAFWEETLGDWEWIGGAAGSRSSLQVRNPILYHSYHHIYLHSSVTCMTTVKFCHIMTVILVNHKENLFRNCKHVCPKPGFDLNLMGRFPLVKLWSRKYGDVWFSRMLHLIQTNIHFIHNDRTCNEHLMSTIKMSARMITHTHTHTCEMPHYKDHNDHLEAACFSILREELCGFAGLNCSRWQNQLWI